MELSSPKKPPCIIEPSACEIDRISRLPDDILHYILSFVDIIDVLRSSVLCRRWKSLWTTMPYLNFDCDAFSDQHHRLIPDKYRTPVKHNFRELINWVLLCQGSTNITRFRLKCDDMFCFDQIARWIQVSKRRNVKELELDFNPALDNDEIELPNFDSLRVLKLRFYWFFSRLPSNWKFNKLTSLHLESVLLYKEDLARKLFSGCIFLEELFLIKCTMLVVDISSSSLKCLTLMEEISNLNMSDASDIRILCPNLISFTYMAAHSKNFYLSDLPFLDKICIDVVPYDYRWSEKQVGDLACYILQQVENIRVLKLHVRAMWCLSHAIEKLQCFSKTFCRLKSLNLSIEIAEDYIQVILLLLKYCPNLESLSLYCDGSNRMQEEPKECSRLYHQERQLNFVKFMLKNGVVLEKFYINFSEDVENSVSTVQKLIRMLQ